MRYLIAIWLCVGSLPLWAGNNNSYRTYLLLQGYKTYIAPKPSAINPVSPQLPPNAFIPRYETPKGAVFCRLEDLLTRKTNVWIKIGVK